MIRKILYILLITSLLAGCRGRSTAVEAVETVVMPGLAGTAPGDEGADDVEAVVVSSMARKLDSAGLVNLAMVDPSIEIFLVYATADNFVGEVLYDDLTEAYLLPEVAEHVAQAQRILGEKHPGYRLIIYDAARPMSVQRKMWAVAVRAGKQYYVANPSKGGGLHNYGAAVDVSILDEAGNPLPMGTEYDHLGAAANTDRESELVRAGVITEEELENRLLLRGVMRQAGFRTVTSEWWHFNWVSREVAKARYALIDF